MPDESRGDAHDDWGPAVYYLWVHDDGVVEQQVEVYDSGVMVAYDRYHREDAFGALTGERPDPIEWAPFEIDVADYQREVAGQPINRRS